MGLSIKNMEEYLKEMTEIALKYDTIIAEPLNAAEHDFDSSYGCPKIYWDTENNKYVFMMPDRTIRG